MKKKPCEKVKPFESVANCGYVLIKRATGERWEFHTGSWLDAVGFVIENVYGFGWEDMYRENIMKEVVSRMLHDGSELRKKEDDKMIEEFEDVKSDLGNRGFGKDFREGLKQVDKILEETGENC